MLKVRCRPLLWACVLWLSASCGVPPQALAQEATSHQHEQGQAKRTHPPQDMALHEKFYSTWRMPDNPALSCCNKADCYPTDIRYVDGRIYAKRREDGKYILIPPQKVERSRDNPDGRNHLCAPPPVYRIHPIPSFASLWEVPREIRVGQWQDAVSAKFLCALL